ncbi:MAG: hypothetical protein JXA21_05765 [Anaerolineae bacterium]|nr:hypothetical protein [Anaerolineae bacterium]
MKISPRPRQPSPNFQLSTFNLQLPTYLKTQAYLADPHYRASGILLYPAIRQTEIPGRIELPDITMRIEYIDLTAPSWPEIEQHLLNIITAG